MGLLNKRDTFDEYIPPDQEPKKKNPKLLIIGVCVVVAAAIVVAIIIMTKPEYGLSPSPPSGGQEVSVPPVQEPTETVSPSTQQPESPKPTLPEKPGEDDTEEDEIYEDGKLIRQVLRNSKGEIIGWLDFTYYDNGEMNEKMEYDADGNTVRHNYYLENGSLSYYWINVYDKNSVITYSARYSDKSIQELSYEYIYNAFGMNTDIVENWYDDYGVRTRSVKNKLFVNSGTVKTAYFYSYESGVEILNEIREFNMSEKLVLDTQYEYKTNGDLNKKTEYEYDEDGKLLLFIHEYNDRNVRILMTEYDYNENGEETEHRISDFNNYGAVTRIRYFLPGEVSPYRTYTPPGSTSSPTPTPTHTTGPTQTPTDSPNPTPSTHVHGAYDPNQLPRLTFDSEGRIYREVYYYDCGHVHHYMEHVYDADGNNIDLVLIPGD